MLRSLLAVALVAAGLPSAAVAQDGEQQEEIFCWTFHPGATYEELKYLCEGDVPPDGYPRPKDPGLTPPGPRTPDCNTAGSRLCHLY